MTTLLAASLYFFLALPVFSQVSAPSDSPQAIQVDNFCGMDNTDPPNTLQDCKCQDCLNVEASILGNSVKKRKGYSAFAALTVATSPVNGAMTYFDVNGNQNTVVCQDLNCEVSQNNGAFTTLISTASSIPRYWSMVAANGIAYGANDKQDKVWVYNNGTLTYSGAIPQCKLLDLTKDRMVCANTSANPNGVSYSKSGDFTTWAVGVNPVDPWLDNIGTPGQQINGLINWNGNEFIFTDQSITSCFLGDQYTTSCGLVSNKLGTNDPLSIVLTPKGVMFKGTDQNFWLYDGINLVNESIEISSLTMTASTGKQYSNTQTTQADWNAGTQSPTGSWNTTIVPGSVRNSSWSVTEASSATYALGTLVSISTTVTGSMYITRPGDVVFTNAGAESGSSPNWNIVKDDGLWQSETDAQINAECPSSPNPHVKFGGRAWKNTSSPPNVPYTIPIVIKDASGNVLTSTSEVISNSMNWSELNVALPTGYSQIKVSISDGRASNISVMTSSAIVNGYNLPLWFMGCDNGSGSVFPVMDMDETISQPLTGTYTTQCYDTSFSTPTWGPFAVQISSPDASSGVTFQTKVATTCTGSFDAAVAVTSGSRVASGAKEAIELIANFTLNSSTNNPAGFTNDVLSATTTGFFETQCINTTGMSATWGTLNCAESNVGSGGGVNLFIASATTCGGIQNINGSWTSQANNTAVAISTNASIGIRFQSLLGSATDVAQIDACTLNWVNGTLAPPVFGLYDPQNNSVYWAFSVNQSSFNTRVVKYDLNLSSFYPFSLYSDSLLLFNNNLYFGGSNGGYWNQYGLTDNDNSAAINGYFKTRDFNCNGPFNEAIWQDFSFVALNEPSGTITNTWTLDRGTTGNYSVSISTTSTIPYVRSNKLLPSTSPATYANFNLSNSAANQPFEIIGYQVGCYQKAWRPLTP